MTGVTAKTVGTARERAWAGECTPTLSWILSLAGHSPACIPISATVMKIAAVGIEPTTLGL